MKRSRDDLIARLESDGFRFREIECVTEGDWLVDDVEWNYKDLAHIDHIHHDFRPLFTAIGDEYCASIDVVNIYGIRLPMTQFTVAVSERGMLYHSSFFVFVLVVETIVEEVAPGRSRAVTVYAVGAPRLFQWCIPAVGWLLRRNYRRLMSDDVPMRDRRSELRRWGFRFIGSGGYPFRRSLDITKDHVVPPEDETSPTIAELRLDHELETNGEVYIGRDDHLGVRIVRRSEEVVIFPRLCPHEGASLDGQSCLNEEIRCPWHGRRVPPIATFSLRVSAPQKALSRFHQAVLENGVVRIIPR